MKTTNNFPSVGVPASIRDTPPGPGAVRLTGTRVDGLPDGVHTGGAWLMPDDTVWKPLDGRPYANCEFHFPTKEYECLLLMQGFSLFPKNWKYVYQNKRAWLVRKKALVYGRDIPMSDLGVENLFMIEQAVRNLNQHYWEIGDDISVAHDGETGELFILDLSTAHEQHGVAAYAPDDEFHIHKLFDQSGAHRLVLRRQKAKHLVSEWSWTIEHEGYKYVYGSYSRPISNLWARELNAHFVHNDYANWDIQLPWTWVVTQKSLDADTLARYELVWAWSPLEYIFSDGSVDTNKVDSNKTDKVDSNKKGD